jgi:hypothetical protein
VIVCRQSWIFESVRTQFFKDDVEASDPLFAGLFDDGVDGDDRV